MVRQYTGARPGRGRRRVLRALHGLGLPPRQRQRPRRLGRGRRRLPRPAGLTRPRSPPSSTPLATSCGSSPRRRVRAATASTARTCRTRSSRRRPPGAGRRSDLRVRRAGARRLRLHRRGRLVPPVLRGADGVGRPAAHHDTGHAHLRGGRPRRRRQPDDAAAQLHRAGRAGPAACRSVVLRGDLALRVGSGAYTGDGVLAPAQQQRKARLPLGERLTATVRLTNRGTGPAAYTLSAARPGAGSRPKWFLGGRQRHAAAPEGSAHDGPAPRWTPRLRLRLVLDDHAAVPRPGDRTTIRVVGGAGGLVEPGPGAPEGAGAGGS